MDPHQREGLANVLRNHLKSCPDESEVARLAQEFKIDRTAIREIVDEIWPRPEASPFLTIDFGSEIRPGIHLSPQCAVHFAGWNGHLTIRTWIEGDLHKDGWHQSPRLTPEAMGYWTFPQSLSLMRGGKNCQPGQYWIMFECDFHSPFDHSGFESSWTGRVRLNVPDGDGARTLEIDSGGQGLVNLNGISLREFTTIKLRADEHALINVQEFALALKSEMPHREKDGNSTLVIPVPLLRAHSVGGSIERPVTTARLDLPSGRRIVLFAHDQLILGKARPTSAKPADVTLRLLPRTVENEAISDKLSRQHLMLSVGNGRVIFVDPREHDHKSVKPASLDEKPLPTEPLALKPGRPYRYGTLLGWQQAIGLDFTAFYDEHCLEQTHPARTRIQSPRAKPMTWNRDHAGIDAVRIDRSANTDEFNGRESYLMVLGCVLIGSSAHCPIRIEGPNVRQEHAVLIHWDGQFRLLPLAGARVVCDQRELASNMFVQLRPDSRQRIRFGDVEVILGPRAQLELDPE